MEGERIYQSLEDIREDGGYYSLFIAEDLEADIWYIS